MKNKISSLLLLSLSQLAFAQVKTNQEVNQGSINKQTAFLDASSSAIWNGTNNQGKGLVFPRTDLTVMNSLIATPNGIGSSYPTRLDGMVVYNIGKGTAKTGTSGVEVKPGFYYYDNKSNTLNGGTWKPFSPAETSEAEWIYDATSKQIKLKRSGQGTFTNQVYYNEKGGLINIDADSYPVYSILNDREELETLDFFGVNKTLKLSKNIDRISNKANTAHEKRLGYNALVINNEEPSSNTRYYGIGTLVTTTSADTKAHDQVYGNSSNISLSGGGSVNYAIANLASNQIIKSEIKGYTASTVSDAYLYTPKRIGTSYGVLNRNYIYGNGAIDNLIGGRFGIYAKPNSSSHIKLAITQDIVTSFEPSSNITIDELFGIRYSGINSLGASNGSQVTTAYGISIGDIRGATNNYSLYTHTGKVRIGDLALGDAPDRPVYVDANGVLKTGEAGATQLSGTEGIECNDTNRGKMNFKKDIPLSNGKTTDALGICMKNSDGNYYWRYFYGGMGNTTGTGTFGSNLQ